MATTTTKNRLQQMYMEQVAPKLMKEFGLKNISQVLMSSFQTSTI
jgi:hypothetical protein